MSCINANITRASAAGNVAVSWVKDTILNVIRGSFLSVNVNQTSAKGTVTVTADIGMKVSVGNVCVVSVADGNEMWYCTSWRVLWDGGVKALWTNN